VELDGENVLDPKLDLNLLQARIGMVFQKPTLFPMPSQGSTHETGEIAGYVSCHVRNGRNLPNLTRLFLINRSDRFTYPSEKSVRRIGATPP